MSKGRIYSDIEYKVLSGNLSPEALTCLGYCGCSTDTSDRCPCDGNCSLQDRAEEIVDKLNTGH